MKFSTKTTATMISLLLMLIIAISLFALPMASAHMPAWEIPTYAYIIVAPNPIGVGQSVHIIMWLDKTFDSTALTNDYRFHNYKLTITDPDGKTETQTFDVIWDPTSSRLDPFRLAKSI